MTNKYEYDQGYGLGGGATQDQARGARDAEIERQRREREHQEQMEADERLRQERARGQREIEEADRRSAEEQLAVEQQRRGPARRSKVSAASTPKPRVVGDRMQKFATLLALVTFVVTTAVLLDKDKDNLILSAIVGLAAAAAAYKLAKVVLIVGVVALLGYILMEKNKNDNAAVQQTQLPIAHTSKEIKTPSVPGESFLTGSTETVSTGPEAINATPTEVATDQTPTIVSEVEPQSPLTSPPQSASSTGSSSPELAPESSDLSTDGVPLPEGTVSRLLQSGYIQLVTDRKLPTYAWVFHSQNTDVASLGFEYVQYRLADSSLVLVHADGTRVDLGIRVRNEEILAAIPKVTEIAIIQTHNGMPPTATDPKPIRGALFDLRFE